MPHARRFQLGSMIVRPVAGRSVVPSRRWESVRGHNLPVRDRKDQWMGRLIKTLLVAF